MNTKVIKYQGSRRSGQILDSTPASRSSKAAEVDHEEIIQVRLRQQEIANERAIEAAKIKKKKMEEERERKNNVAKERKTLTMKGNRLGNASATGTGGYNPLQPHSSGGTGGYK